MITILAHLTPADVPDLAVAALIGFAAGAAMFSHASR